MAMTIILKINKRIYFKKLQILDIDSKIPENKFSIVFGQNINNHTNIIKQIILNIFKQSSSKLNIIKVFYI